jgi:hypothetical protein
MKIPKRIFAEVLSSRRKKLPRAVFFSHESKPWISIVLRIFALFLLGIGLFAAGLGLDMPQSRAAGGDAPWCIINDEGDLHCYYASSQACLAEIAGGNRGFCTQNPAGGAAASAPSERAPRRRK